MQEIRSSNPPVVAGICDPNKSRARYHHSLKLGSKLKYIKSILQFIRPSPYRTFNCHNPIEIKLIARLRLGLSHLQCSKLKHNFLDCLNPICCCDKDIETTGHYLLYCPIFSDERSIFLDKIRSIDESILSGIDSRIFETLLFGISSCNNKKNASILNTTIDYILSTKRFIVLLPTPDLF